MNGQCQIIPGDESIPPFLMYIIQAMTEPDPSKRVTW